jgi:hypothetical protein
MAEVNASLVKRDGQGVEVNYENYQVTAKDASYPKTVVSRDTGTILGTVPPGKAGLKLVDGTQQAAVRMDCAVPRQTVSIVGGTQVMDGDGNFIRKEDDPTYRGNAAGYSNLGE